jgi:dual specificity MAP kinase phosphatase
MMKARIKSIARVVVILSQMFRDNLHRYIYGIPNLKRCQITADLFLGSQYTKAGLKKLKELGITAIVNMRIHNVYVKARYEGIKYLHLPTVDNTAPALDDLRKGAIFIENEIKNKGKVYVHCRQGLGRGPTMALAYLIKTGLTFNDAFALVRRVRTFINPRAEQISRLKELEAYYRAHEKKSNS